MRTKLWGIFFSILFLSSLTACQTLKFDPSAAELPALSATAPKVAVIINDSRSTSRVGNVGGLTVKCPSSTAVDYMRFNIKKILAESGVNAVYVSDSIQSGDATQILKIAQRNNAKGVIFFDLARITGNSFDETISPPDYISEGLFVAYDASGSKTFAEQLSGVHTSRAVMTGAKSEAIQQSVLMMFSQLRSSSKYDQWIAGVKR